MRKRDLTVRTHTLDWRSAEQSPPFPKRTNSVLYLTKLDNKKWYPSEQWHQPVQDCESLANLGASQTTGYLLPTLYWIARGFQLCLGSNSRGCSASPNPNAKNVGFSPRREVLHDSTTTNKNTDEEKRDPRDQPPELKKEKC